MISKAKCLRVDVAGKQITLKISKLTPQSSFDYLQALSDEYLSNSCQAHGIETRIKKHQ